MRDSDWHLKFKEYHIQSVLNELQIRFGFPLKHWQKKFSAYGTRESDIVGRFLYFGNEVINPILNGILCRNPGHPTFNNLCAYVVTKRG
jgi:hypothetical protein